MIIAPKKRAQLTFADFKIHQLHNFDDVIIGQLKRYTQFFQDVVVCHFR